MKYKFFTTIHGHPLPKVYEIEGKGYQIRFALDQLGAEFMDTPTRLP